MRIHPGWVARIPMEGPVKGHNDWFMERVILPTHNRSFLATPATLIKSKELILAVANMSPSVEWIQKGDVLGVLHDPDQYLDRVKKGEETQCLEAYV
jgi:hypothetical protein